LSTISFHPAFGQTYQTLGLGGCVSGQCHATENRWYSKDAHKKSFNNVLSGENTEAYLAKMGMNPTDLEKRDNMCMVCHGTPVSAQKEVDQGVSCESCHGPGSGYKDPHQEKGGEGPGRSGYLKGVKLGMRDFRRDKTQVAAVCVGCHYVTDDRLLRTGHPSGADFRYTSKINTVAGYPDHWKSEPKKEDYSKELFDAARKSRGGKVPALPVPSAGPVARDAVSEPAARREGVQVSSPVRRLPTPLPPRPVDPMSIPVAAGPVDLPPFPAVTDSTQLDSLLLLLKQRLELLHEKSRR
jgi:hypothetical protein